MQKFCENNNDTGAPGRGGPSVAAGAPQRGGLPGMKWRVSTTEAEARPHPAPAADMKTAQTAPTQPPAGSPQRLGKIFPHGKPMSNMGEKHKGRGKAGKLSVVPILWESQGETDVSTPHLRG